MTNETTEIETSGAEDGSHESALLYAIVEAGYFRRNIGGIFTSLEKACAEAKFNVLYQDDYFHNWTILEFKPDIAVDGGKRVGTVVWDYDNNIATVKFEKG